MKIDFTVTEDDLGKIVLVHKDVETGWFNALQDHLTEDRFRAETVRYRRVGELNEGTVESVEL